MSISSCQASRQTTCLPIYAWDLGSRHGNPGWDWLLECSGKKKMIGKNQITLNVFSHAQDYEHILLLGLNKIERKNPDEAWSLDVLITLYINNFNWGEVLASGWFFVEEFNCPQQSVVSLWMKCGVDGLLLSTGVVLLTSCPLIRPMPLILASDWLVLNEPIMPSN